MIPNTDLVLCLENMLKQAGWEKKQVADFTNTSKKEALMSFTLTKEQMMIQKMAREFSRKVLAETAAERDVTKTFPAENIK